MTCYIFIETKYEEPETGIQVVDKNTKDCVKCGNQKRAGHNDHNFNQHKTHCKNGHVLDNTRMINGKLVRSCNTCMRMAERRHRDRNPGYHAAYKKKRLTKEKEKVKDKNA